MANLGVAFPALAEPDRQRLCRLAYQHLGTMAVEVCRLLHDPRDPALSDIAIDGREHVDAVMRTHGRGLVVTAHLGNWELLSLAQRLTGYPVSIVVRPLDAVWLDESVRRLRAATGVEIIDKRDALRAVLGALRRGRLVAILLDQNATRDEGVFVPFFGWPASTSRSVAVLALRTGAPILPVFIRREALGRHRITIEPPIMPQRSSSGAPAIAEVTRQCTLAVERAVRATPDQWFWMHDRWRTRPPGERRVRS
jgi:Kdo2-lipid IVA lauroyltransferase/acyltransferase